MIVAYPADSVEAPRQQRAKINPWTVDQARNFLAYVADDKDAAIWRLLFATGCRIGEALALSWDDIDWQNGTVSIHRTLTNTPNGIQIGTQTKTGRGRRVALPPVTLDALRTHRVCKNEMRLALGPAWQDHDLVFSNTTGGARSAACGRDRFKTLTTKAGSPVIRLHDVRHTAATLMLANGEHPRVVSERLGHANVGITPDLYSHVSMDMQRDAANRLEQLLGS